MKIFNFFLPLFLLASSLTFTGCKDDDTSKASSQLQQHKWVCEYSDLSVDIGISDYYTTTLYFVNNSECLVRCYHKRYDANSTPHYSSDEEFETIQYTVNGDQITFSKSRLIQYDEAYNYVESGFYWHDFFYQKQTLTSSDQDYISQHYTPKPAPSPSGMSFMGLKSVGDINYFQCDNLGRLTAYGTDGEIAYRYEYSSNKITKYNRSGSDVWKYNLTNGLITSWALYIDSGTTLYEDYKVTYNSNNQIVRITMYKYGNYVGAGETIWDYKWTKDGNLSEVLCDSETWYTYDYLSSHCKFEILSVGIKNIDQYLLLQGYYGNSIPKNNVKTGTLIVGDNTQRLGYTYSYDSKGRVEEVNIKNEFIYPDGDVGVKYSTQYYVWE